MYRKLTGSRIIVTVSLILVWMTMVMSSGPVPPAWSLAAAVATPDCSGLEAYQQQLTTIRDNYRSAFLERLPGVQPEWEITGGVDLMEAAFIQSDIDYGLAWTNWLMGRSKAQLIVLSELWTERANQLRALQPPPVAQALHEKLISDTEFFADLYQSGSEEGAMMAIFAIMLSGDDGTPSIVELNDQLVASCPAWAAYQVEAGGTATPDE